MTTKAIKWLVAVRALEQLADGEVARPSNALSPGVTIRIINQVQPAPIDVTPAPARIIDAGEQ